jgi:CheY-like chemotaxis protein
MRILVVDDEPARHKLFLQRLSKGNQVTIVTNYHSAVRELNRTGRFDLVYLDYDLDEYSESPIEYGQFSKHHNGVDVAQFIATMPKSKQPKQAIVHSLNASKAPIMLVELESGGIKADYQPFKYT